MTSPRALLNAWNVNAKRQLGQNFLSEPSTAKAIVDRAGLSSDEIVLEIGAGLGALTVPAARRVQKVYALETDGRIVDLLQTELLAAGVAEKVALLHADILKFDIPKLAASEGVNQFTVLGNLPYHISSQVLAKLVAERAAVSRAVLMFQKEMADRIMAQPGGRDYGRLAVLVAYCAKVRPLLDVAAPRFYPRPKIDSAVLTFSFVEPPRPARDEAFLFQVVRAAFGQRRKTLRNALAGGGINLSPAEAQAGLEAAGVDPARRAETLSVAEFVALSHALLDQSL
ncbi:MAG: 16S rRNA (adenine(1518)-N(6)/adenine(1519)-N(6))-dimethyltransferase RsmA [Thermodesulfobacteriota bacterium]